MKKFLLVLTMLCIAFLTVQHETTASETKLHEGVFYEIVTLPNGKQEVHITGNAATTQHIVIPEKIENLPVTAIANRAFYTMYSDYMNDLESMEENTSYQKTKVKSVQLPATLKTIGETAFANNYLTDVKIPASVVEIGAGAFADNLLTTITIPNNVTKVGAWAFSGNQLTKITLSKKLTAIEDGVFAGNQLATFTIPATVKSIGSEAFASNQLTAISIATSVTSIGQQAFAHNKLKALTIPKTVKTMGPNIVENNPLKKVTLPDHLQQKKDKVHGDLYYTIVKRNGKNEVKITSYNTKTKKMKLTVPATINKMPVTEIDAYAFAPHLSPTGLNVAKVENLKIKQVDLPNSIRKIGTSAFVNSGIVPTKLPTNLEEIGANAYNLMGSHASLKEIARNFVIPSKVKTIGANAFAGMKLKGTLTIPKSVTFIGEGAFQYNAFTKVTLNATIKEIAPYTFAYNQIKDLTIPKSVTTIGKGAFMENKIPRLVLPANVKIVGREAFMGNLITSVSLPNGVTTIEPFAFYRNRITTITVPASVTKFDVSAVNNTNFATQNKLKTIIFKGTKTVITNELPNNWLYTDAKNTKLFTNYNKVQAKPITLYAE